MTRSDVGQRLLALGPLTFRAFMEITGWPKSTAYFVIRQLESAGKVRRFVDGRSVVFELKV